MFKKPDSHLKITFRQRFKYLSLMNHIMHLLFKALVLGVWMWTYFAAQASAQNLSDGERILLSQTLAAAQNKEWQRAALLARDLPEPLPMAIEWYRLINQEPLPGFTALAEFREARPQWPGRKQLGERAEQAALNAPAAAVSAHFEHFPPTTAHGSWALARVFKHHGDPAGAVAVARAAWRQGTGFTEADEKAFLAEFRSSLTVEDHRARLDALAWQGLEAQARRTLVFVDEDYRKLINARLWVRYAKPGVDARVAAVPPALVNDPGLLYERARFRRRAGNLAGAAEILLSPPAELGDPQLWWEERRIGYRYALRNGNAELAYRLAAVHGHVDGPGFADCEWHAGWIALRFLHRPAEALSHFERMWKAVDTPISRGRAAYWAGRAASALGDKSLAKTWYTQGAAYPISFYGQESAREIDGAINFERRLPTAELDAYRKTELPRLALLLAQVKDTLILPDITDAMVLRAEGLNGIANAVTVAMEAQRYDSTILGNIALFQAGCLSAAASHPIPTIFSGLLQPADPDVPPALALAVARQESRFDIAAISSKGARGLMQVMPATARQIARQHGLSADTRRLTHDPEYNARLGTHYLGDLLRRFNHVALAAAAYNAGPQRAQQWIVDLGDPRRLDHYALIDWLEQIPFHETRNYVQRIIEGHRIYELLLAGQ